MSAQKIRKKQIAQQQWLMGKGKYMLLQNKVIKVIPKQALSLLQKKIGAAQAATNYLP